MAYYWFLDQELGALYHAKLPSTWPINKVEWNWRKIGPIRLTVNWWFEIAAAFQSGAYVHRGDSGGGLVFRHNDAWFLRGVVSIAPPEDKSISAYTNVSYHRDWIVTLEQVAALRRAYLNAFFLG